MTGSRAFWIVLAVILVPIVIAIAFRLEWVEESFDSGYAETARRNGFLAAEQFLSRQSVESEVVTGMQLLDALPSTDDLILMSAPRESLSERRAAALVSWVEEGGQLLVVAHSVYDASLGASRDPLLDRLGVFLLDSSDDEEWEDESETEFEEEEELVLEEPAVPPPPDLSEAAETETRAAEDAAPTTLGEALIQAFEQPACEEDESTLEAISVGDADGRPARVALSSFYELGTFEDRLEEAYLSPRGQLLSLPVGEGSVIAMTSVSPFRNEQIHCHDHAWLLWFATRHVRKVHLLHDPDVPSLVDLARTHYPLALWGGGALLLLAAATASLRFGRATPARDAGRRRHLEHLEATVSFRHRKGGFAPLFERVLNDLRAGAPRDTARWARRARLDGDRVSSALRDEVPRSRREILERTTTLLRLRRTR